MHYQQTLREAVEISGIGLHSGKTATVRIRPAQPGTGIRFVRTDLPGSPAIAAHFSKVTNTQMATTLTDSGVSVTTVEHLMAALCGLSIDNATVELAGPELPILDGSAQPFVAAILRVGVDQQAKRRSIVRLRRKVELRIGAKWAVAEPSDRFEVQGSVEWDHPAIGFQEFSFVEGETSHHEWAPARTFGFLKDVEALQRMGLIKGGSLENAVVLDQSGVLNPEGLRFRDEFARHKVLDALGDFKLAGIGLQARFRLHRAGHDVHSQILQEIFRNPENFEIEDAPKELVLPQPTGERRRRIAVASPIPVVASV